MTDLTKKKNRAVGIALLMLSIILFGIGFLRVNGKGLPTPKKSVFDSLQNVIKETVQKKTT